ncbi:DUF3889 domain-containing protein [Paenibacillus qinlingensis]|uniref:DUF3889 domain-containing protein n=1 Tax=Paenibacillus qinlingensis TaxID=1837343 RepID=UPI00286DCF9D|nr:DUF3889 domain-containing protein [Paenibacillus qinlingensis]
MFGLNWVGFSPALARDTIQHDKSDNNVLAPIQDPSYAKWSRLAFHEAGKVYTLLDYKYIGKSNVAPGVVQQQFRFWVKKNGAEFPLIVSIRYDPVTEKVFTILMEQENRGTLQIL